MKVTPVFVGLIVLATILTVGSWIEEANELRAENDAVEITGSQLFIEDGIRFHIICVDGIEYLRSAYRLSAHIDPITLQPKRCSK